jgi:hypothetical protein
VAGGVDEMKYDYTAWMERYYEGLEAKFVPTAQQKELADMIAKTMKVMAIVQQLSRIADALEARNERAAMHKVDQGQ